MNEPDLRSNKITRLFEARLESSDTWQGKLYNDN